MKILEEVPFTGLLFVIRCFLACIFYASPVSLDDPRRHSHDGASVRHVFDDYRIGTNRHVVADNDSTEHFRSRGDAHAISDDWSERALMSDRDLLIDPAIGTNVFGGYDRGKSVLNKQPWAYVASADVQRWFWRTQPRHEAAWPSQAEIEQAAKLGVSPH